MSDSAWYYDDGIVRRARVTNRGAHASEIEYRANGMVWRVTVSNDDIEFIGDNLDDED